MRAAWALLLIYFSLSSSSCFAFSFLPLVTNFALAAGGRLINGEPSSLIHIYWTMHLQTASPVERSASLSVARFNLTGAATKRLHAFAGGNSLTGPSDVVDLYDSNSGWTQYQLAYASTELLATATNSTIAFAQRVRNATVVDFFTAIPSQGIQHYTDEISDTCYRSSFFGSDITFMCTHGVQSYSPATRNWTQYDFLWPVQPDEWAQACIQSHFMEGRIEALRHGGPALILTACGANVATIDTVQGENFVYANAHDMRTECPVTRVYESLGGSSAAYVVPIFSYALDRFDVTLLPLNVGLLVAGGRPTRCCNSSACDTALLNEIVMLPEYMQLILPSVCTATPPADAFLAYCVNSAIRISSHYLFKENSTFNITNGRLAFDGGLTLGPGARLYVAENAEVSVASLTMMEGSQLYVCPGSPAIEVKGGLLLYPGARINVELDSRFWTRSVNKTVVTLRTSAMPHVWPGAGFNLHGCWDYENRYEVTLYLLYSTPGNSLDWPLISVTLADDITRCKTAVTVPRRRHSCPASFTLGTHRYNDALELTPSNSAVCGLMLDSVLILMGYAALAIVVCVALWVQTPFESGYTAVLAEECSEQATCPICLTEFTDPVKTACKHLFCRICLEQWVALGKPCPVCRSTVVSDARYIQRSFIVTSFIVLTIVISDLLLLRVRATGDTLPMIGFVGLPIVAIAHVVFMRIGSNLAYTNALDASQPAPTWNLSVVIYAVNTAAFAAAAVQIADDGDASWCVFPPSVADAHFRTDHHLMFGRMMLIIAILTALVTSLCVIVWASWRFIQNEARRCFVCAVLHRIALVLAAGAAFVAFIAGLLQVFFTTLGWSGAHFILAGCYFAMLSLFGFRCERVPSIAHQSDVNLLTDRVVVGPAVLDRLGPELPVVEPSGPLEEEETGL